jgi:hypothetical protein
LSAALSERSAKRTRVEILNQGLWQSTRQFEPRSLPTQATDLIAVTRKFSPPFLQVDYSA